MSNTKLFHNEDAEKYRLRALKRRTEKADFLLAHAAADIVDRLSSVDRSFQHAVDLHGYTGLGKLALVRSGKVKKVTSVETSPAWFDDKDGGIVSPRDRLKFPSESVDLILSLFGLQISNDLFESFVQIRNKLKPDGLFLGVIAGRGTLYELREALFQAETTLYGGVSPRVSPFADVKDIGELLHGAQFALPVCDVETLTVRYSTIFHLMHDLRHMGMQNSLADRSRRPVGKRFFATAAGIYKERFSDIDGRLRATFSLIWFSGWAPHPNHARPARPGSARQSLAAALAAITKQK